MSLRKIRRRILGRMVALVLFGDLGSWQVTLERASLNRLEIFILLERRPLQFGGGTWMVL